MQYRLIIGRSRKSVVLTFIRSVKQSISAKEAAVLTTNYESASPVIYRRKQYSARMGSLSQIQKADAVSVSLADLKSGNVSHETLLDAFGPSSLGILVVTGLPPTFPQLRSTVLSNSSHLAALPPSTLETLTNASAKYLVGWSHGKEQLRPGVVDTLKGSYYINCAFYQDPSLLGADASRHPGFEEYTADSIWPDENHGDLPGFRKAAEELITLIIDTAVLVARACDQYAQSEIAGYTSGYLERVVRTSLTTKARLLHYFPTEASSHPNGTPPNAASNDDNDDEDDWCATHLDHGCLTGLTSAMFLDEIQPESTPNSNKAQLLHELDTSPDPASGLYIQSRSGSTVKVSIPRDALAFQTGEALELITQGKFKAVPHFVKGAKAVGGDNEGAKRRRIARNTLAVFTQPNLDEIVDVGKGWTFGEFAHGVVGRNTIAT